MDKRTNRREIKHLIFFGQNFIAVKQVLYIFLMVHIDCPYGHFQIDNHLY